MTSMRACTAHGSLTTYKKGCRCGECVRVARRYDKKRRYDAATVGPRRVDARPAHRHLTYLLDHGATVRSIADQMGYKHTASVLQLLKRDRIRRSTLTRVLATRGDSHTPDLGVMPPDGTQRRLQALMYMGWQTVDVVRETGADGTVLSDILRGVTPGIRQKTFARVRDFYDAHAHVDGGSERSKRRARREGWAPPVAWDDIDDPNAKPIGVRP